MLEIKNLHAGYAGRSVLSDVSLTAHAGKITAIIGPNGCGKSTLLKSVCGILPAFSGQVTLDGEQLLSLPQNMLARKVAYLSQSRQIPDITVRRLVLHGRFPYLSYPRRYRAEDHEAADAALMRMDLMKLADAPLNCLSGGQRQRAYFAMALAQNTDVILLDEPTTYLDVSYQLQVLQQARALADSGKHILMVIHDLSHAMETADGVVLMKDGAIVTRGTPAEVYDSGLMDEVFGVKIARVQIGDCWRYFCTEAK